MRVIALSEFCLSRPGSWLSPRSARCVFGRLIMVSDHGNRLSVPLIVRSPFAVPVCACRRRQRRSPMSASTPTPVANPGIRALPPGAVSSTIHLCWRFETRRVFEPVGPSIMGATQRKRLQFLRASIETASQNGTQPGNWII